MSTNSDFSRRRWKGYPGRGWGCPGNRGIPGGLRRGELRSRVAGDGVGGKTFLLPGDDVKTPGLERRMGWERKRREATLEQGGGEWGWGESGGLGAGKGRRSPPPPPFPPIPTHRGKELPARELVGGGGGGGTPMLHPREMQERAIPPPRSPLTPPPSPGTGGGRTPSPAWERRGGGGDAAP